MLPPCNVYCQIEKVTRTLELMTGRGKREGADFRFHPPYFSNHSTSTLSYFRPHHHQEGGGTLYFDCINDLGEQDAFVLVRERKGVRSQEVIRLTEPGDTGDNRDTN